MDTTHDGGPVQSTDRELWREREDDYYADSIHVTERGGIGINHGGLVIVKTLAAWHALAVAADPQLCARAQSSPQSPSDTMRAHLAEFGK